MTYFWLLLLTLNNRKTIETPYPMFENIKIEELIKRLTKTTDEREAMAEKASNDKPYISGKSLWMAARFAGNFTDKSCIGLQGNLVVMQDVNHAHVAMYNITLGSHEPLVMTFHEAGKANAEFDSTQASSVQTKQLKDFVSKHKKSSKKHTDVVEIDEARNQLRKHDGFGEFSVMSLKPNDAWTPKLPTIKLDTVLEHVDLKEFRTALKAVKFVSEISTFQYDLNGEDLVLTSESPCDSITAKVSVADTATTDQGAKAQYATSYLKPIQWLNKETQLKISYQSNMPLRIDFKGEEAGTIYSGFIYLAPRIDHDY